MVLKNPLMTLITIILLLKKMINWEKAKEGIIQVIIMSFFHYISDLY